MSRLRDWYLRPRLGPDWDYAPQMTMYTQAEIWTKKEGQLVFDSVCRVDHLSFGWLTPRIEVLEPKKLPNNQFCLGTTRVFDTNTIYHRVGGPAITLWNGPHKLVELYLQNGKLHREDGPAKTTLKETNEIIFQEWRRHDYLHRADGPAIICQPTPGTWQHHWFWQGYLHRADGPARSTGHTYEDCPARANHTTSGWFLESAQVDRFDAILKATNMEEKTALYAQYCKAVRDGELKSRFEKKRAIMLVGKHVLRHRRLAKFVKMAANFGATGTNEESS